MKEDWYVVPARRALREETQQPVVEDDEEIQAALLVLTPRVERRNKKER